jgi:asparagine synthase (glutamine-hydrolysing)
MCGIAGLMRGKRPVDQALIRTMTDTMIPRGPDSSGAWISDDGQLGFGHRRLAIIDLTEAGAQPMHSACGRYTLTYNGEIYNFQELRAELEAAGLAPRWRGHCDAEVILAAFAAWGVRKTLEKSLGMFALAVWDHADRTLTLARDRFGEKPLYYGWTAAGFAFGSTLGPIRATPSFANPVAQEAVACLMARAYVPAPLSIYRRIYKLPPGCLLTLSGNAAALPMDSPPSEGGTGPIRLERYFDYADQVLAGAADPVSDRKEALEELDAVLTRAVGRQMVADVPVGNFLSGGIDSSLITAIAQKCVPRSRPSAAHRSYRAVHFPRRRPGGDPRTTGDVRRTFRRFIASAHPSGLKTGARTGYGLALGRCRGRAVRRLQPAHPVSPPVARAEQGAGAAAQHGAGLCRGSSRRSLERRIRLAAPPPLSLVRRQCPPRPALDGTRRQLRHVV